MMCSYVSNLFKRKYTQKMKSVQNHTKIITLRISTCD